MSEQRRYRKELRQGLHQFLMQIYMAYLETSTEAEAKQYVKEVMIEQFKYFSTEDLGVDQTRNVLSNKIKELTDKMNDAKDFDTQMYYAEKIDTLNATIEIL